jgi:transcriptional regulator with XRE-family HTH domain
MNGYTLSTVRDKKVSPMGDNRPMPEIDGGRLSEDVRARLARSLTAAMARCGLTVSALYKQTGVSRAEIYRLLGGKSLANGEILVRIADAVKMSPGLLLDGYVPEDPKPQTLDRQRWLEGQAAKVPALERDLSELEDRVALILERLPPKRVGEQPDSGDQ